jgi:hypothetical protein
MRRCVEKPDFSAKFRPRFPMVEPQTNKMSKHHSPHTPILSANSQNPCLLEVLMSNLRKNGNHATPKLFLEALREAKALQTNSRILSPEEKNRFDMNREILNRYRDEKELRKYTLLEVFETKQWRQNYQSFDEYAFIEGGLKKAQARKSVDSARIVIDFAEAGLEHITPKGRQIEELIKVSRPHWIESWSHVLKVFEIDGCSIEVVKSSLRDYCRDRNLQFGRRKPNGSKNIGLPSLMIARVPSKIRDARTIEKGEDWIDFLSSDEKDLLKALHDNQDERHPDYDIHREIPTRKSSDILTKIASNHTKERPRARKMEAVLLMLQAKAPDLAKQLAEVALAMLYEKIQNNSKSDSTEL